MSHPFPAQQVRSRSSAVSIRQLAFAAVAFLGVVACSGGGGGGGGGSANSTAAAELAAVRYWNTVAIDATGLDHMPSNQGPAHTFGQQVGPCRAARAEAIVHVAVFEVLNSIHGGYESYTGLGPAQAGTSAVAGIAQAAHDTLVAMWPSQSAIFATHLSTALDAVPDGAAKTQGIALGANSAAQILFLRQNDGSEIGEMAYGSIGGVNPAQYNPTDAVGEWRRDPIAQQGVAMGARWGETNTFVIQSTSQFRLPPPPALDSAEYAAAYNEVLTLGGDGDVTPTTRTPDQTHIGNYWAYDGVPSLCAPPRLYNQIAVHIAEQRGTDAIGTSRLLALLNLAMADGAVSCWDSKYFYKFWRPVTGIREANGGADSPSGLDDGNPLTTGDPTYVPLCAPASNQNPGVNFTPPFPSYPSGHATFGGAIFQVLRRFYGTNNIAFTFTSDEYNGVTTDSTGTVRPLLPRSFDNLTEPELENGLSRIYLGIHWRFDAINGIQQGNNIGNYVFDHVYQPVN